ncbi:MAG TPA: 16S rRNA (cytosine(1402)-N(4))-methyltransferase RsmH [Acidimicrobiia bacterium]|nr:16S rRNA (cytosine(1402)-N(4))-methyltransferase RsmH [Acidimicrobiia bacterium]
MGRPQSYHRPVLTDRVIFWMQPLDGGVILDATYGGGGHTAALLSALPRSRLVALDRDPDARPEDPDPRVSFRLADFRALDRALEEEDVDDLAGAVFDLGVSSHQLDVGERGFSYRIPGPLDMRMGPDAPHTAADVVNHWDEVDISRILREYGEERFSGRIARAIVASRPIRDTAHLADVVAGAVPPGPRKRPHPARRTFQAVRIAVNDELAALADGLDVALRVLRPGGRIVVISYHSLEDRIVKRRFAAGSRGCVCPPDLPVCACDRVAELRILTRRPEVPTPDEMAENPRSRSARLRAAERV